MSYDYILVKGAPGQGLEALIEGGMANTLGDVESVKASIAGLFPSIRWQPGRAAPGMKTPPGWFGRADTAELQFLAEPDGQVRVLMMTRCERSEVERVAKALGLAAIDEQSMDRF